MTGRANPSALQAWHDASPSDRTGHAPVAKPQKKSGAFVSSYRQKRPLLLAVVGEVGRVAVRCCCHVRGVDRLLLFTDVDAAALV